MVSIQKTAKRPRRVRVRNKPGIYYNDTDDGRRRYQFTYVDGTGKRRWKTVDGGLREAVAERDETRSKLRRGERVAPSSVRVAAFAEEWLAGETQLRPSTIRGYTTGL